MPVVCATCHTHNRDNAMFCKGCAGRLPAFAATGPSALESVRLPPVQRRARPAPPDLAAHTLRLWMQAGATLLALGLAFVLWYMWVTRDVPGRVAEAAQPLARPAAERTDLARAGPAAAPATPLQASLSPGESPVPSDESSVSSGDAMQDASAAATAGTDARAAPGLPAIAAAPVALAAGPAAPPASAVMAPDGAADHLRAPATTGRTAEAAPPPRPAAPRAAPATRQAALNPRRGCEHLNFIFAARCEANHCEQADYRHHPRCDAVREQRRRDEARRNLTNGY